MKKYTIQMTLGPAGASPQFSGPFQERRWPVQGGAADTGIAAAEEGGPAHLLHVQEAQPSHLKGTGPQTAWSNA